MRKCKLKDKKVIVVEVLFDDFVNKILKLNEGYKVFRIFWGFLFYWECVKKDIFVMIW